MTYIGTIGMFLTFMWLFVRVLPMVSIAELRTLYLRPMCTRRRR